MISFVGYNFLSDLSSVDPYPTNAGIFNQVEIYRAIYDHIDISNDTTITSNIPPTQWDFGTILNCNFNGNISGGTIKDFSSGITQVRVKKRKVGEFDWQIIKTYDISSSEDLSFVFNDYLTATNTEYEYAYVPVFGSVEGQYAISTVMSQFDGVFVCDANTIFKFNMGVEYGSTDIVQQVGTFTVLGRKYPIVMSNGLANYQTGQLSGLVLPEDYEDTRTIDRIAITQRRNKLMEFLTNKKPKIIKDRNQNQWLVIIQSPSTSYLNNYGQGIVSASMQWIEIGDAESNKDLAKAGLIEG